MTKFKVGDEVVVDPEEACDDCRDKVWTITKITLDEYDSEMRHYIDAPCKANFKESSLISVKPKIVKNWRKELGD